ncbi:conserved hypothetical protein [Flavobacterium psychrophilum]|uniref:hypothetical protein n=1 Tax=Flavobacterium psychrophilum TaxID=96345 RepID=UPI000B7C1AE5|nr:hypothetical protein [Flavobacterium psychrophilum]SNA83271.1 conserved hypothetical protein [Flavobacterium psychrophilum]
MTEETRSKIAKVYELVNRGVAGEQDNAKLALDRLMKKHNLSTSDIETIKQKNYSFKYANNLDLWLVTQLAHYFLPDKQVSGYRRTLGSRELVLSLDYLDYVLISTAYEYFKRHMKAQYNEFVLPQIKRCRSVKTKKIRRAELQEIFFSKYIIASKLYLVDEIKQTKLSELSVKKRKDLEVLKDIKGGDYKTQVTTGLYLE